MSNFTEEAAYFGLSVGSRFTSRSYIGLEPMAATVVTPVDPPRPRSSGSGSGSFAYSYEYERSDFGRMERERVRKRLLQDDDEALLLAILRK